MNSGTLRWRVFRPQIGQRLKRAPALDAHRMAPAGFRGQDFFDQHLVQPTVAKVVFVAELEALASGDLAQCHFLLIMHVAVVKVEEAMMWLQREGMKEREVAKGSLNTEIQKTLNGIADELKQKQGDV